MKFFAFCLAAILIHSVFGSNSTNSTDDDMEMFGNETSSIRHLIKRKISDPQWSLWSPWSPCTKSCSGGTQTRTRTCRGADDQVCKGQAKEEKACNQKPCPGKWSPWTDWSICTKDQQTRTRSCTGGKCDGQSTEKRSCRSASWSQWTNWSACPITCGANGQQTRTRTCQNGNDCPNPNSNSEKRPCSPQPPTCSKWTDWNPWSKCSKSCGTGEQTRTRSCQSSDEPGNQIKPSTKATNCVGKDRETQKCNIDACPKWSEWMPWSACSVTCGDGGRQTRKRNCQGGTTCVGQAEESKTCGSLKKCDQGRWSEWTTWGQCTKSCAGGEQTRQRTCTGGKSCVGPTSEKRQCNTQACPNWSEWNWAGQCSVSCGNGTRRRTRNCVGGTTCAGNSEEKVACNNPPCKS